MPRRKYKGGGRKFDTRLDFKEISRLLGLSPRKRIIMKRYLTSKLAKGVNIVEEN